MPIITLEAGKLTKEKKAQFVEEVTEIASRITGVHKEAFVVILKENDPENIGVGGMLLVDKMK